MLRITLLSTLVASQLGGIALAQDGDRDRDRNRPRNDPTTVSPIRGIDRDGPNNPELPPLISAYPSLDGSGNNPLDPLMNAAHSHLSRWATAAYADGASAMAGEDRPSARVVSTGVSDQEDSIPNDQGVSDYLWQWGQFLDHDLDLTDGMDPPEDANIAVPAGDPWFDPNNTGTVEIALNRSLYDTATGSGLDNPRQQINEISGWIDGSQIYGSDSERAEALRTLDGTGRLATSEGNLLPFNEAGLANAGGPSAELFLAGDVRANEQLGLTAMHTLFVREHNWQAQRIADDNPGLSGEEIYQRARRMVTAELQVITYQEFIPALLGPNALPPYRGYDGNVDARISNVFASAAYRFGHSAVSPQLLRLNRNLQPIPAGNLALRDAFFSPSRLNEEGGIAPILRGLAWQLCQRIDPLVVDELRNFLFGAPGAGGLDLAALNIQRGRDHGLPDYNSLRVAMGLAPVASFAEISSDPEIQQRLASVYADVDSVDAWVGGLAEDHLPGAMVGELWSRVLGEQFRVLRDGDRYWYRLVLDNQARNQVENTRLADIIRRNTRIGGEIPDNVFRVQ